MSDFFVEMQQRRSKHKSSVASQTREVLTPTPPHEVNAGDHFDVDEADDALANILSLKLKKPKNWKWELTTSRSCSNIALPRIMLYNHKGDLLVDANSQQEQVFKQPVTELNARNSRRQKRVVSRAASSGLDGAIRKALEHKFDELQIEDVTSPLPEPLLKMHHHHHHHPISAASSEQQVFELPTCKFERRANSCKEVRFKVDDDAAHRSRSNDGSASYYPVVDLPTPPSTTTTTTTATTNSSSGPREKRRFRRSKSSLGRSPATSESILERFSSSRGRYSSPEYAEEHQVQHGPLYFLRTSKAGTLVVQQQSFSRYRRRRKLRNSSTEDMLNNNNSSTKSLSTSSMKLAAANAAPKEKLQLPHNASSQCCSLENVVAADSLTLKRKKTFPVRRNRSDGNMLLAARRSSSSSSETELQGLAERRTLRKYDAYRKKSKNGLVTLGPDNRIEHALERPTAR